MILKACPFCGGKPTIEESQRGFVNGKSTHVCFVRCKQCNARSERVDIEAYGHTSYSSEAVQKVSESWNKRIANYDYDLFEWTTRNEKRLTKMKLIEEGNENENISKTDKEV